MPKLPPVTRAKASTTESLSSGDGDDVQSLSEEGRIILSMLTRRLDEIVVILDARDVRLDNLESDNKELKRKISTLEERLDLLKQPVDVAT